MASNYAPFYNPSVWNDNGKISDSNCMEYAATPDPKNRDSRVANPGESAGDISYALNYSKGIRVTKEELLRLVRLDGFLPVGTAGNTTDLPKEVDGTYLVAMYIRDDGRDFHFARQIRSSDEWSHKPAVEAKVTKVATTPTADGSVPPIIYGSHHSDYTFVSYLRVPENGLKLGYDAYVEKLVDQGKYEEAKSAHMKYKQAHSPEEADLWQRYLESLDLKARSVVEPRAELEINRPATASMTLEDKLLAVAEEVSTLPKNQYDLAMVKLAQIAENHGVVLSELQGSKYNEQVIELV